MKIIVNQHKCKIDTKSIVNENEVNVTEIEFEFIDIPSNYVKEAYFTLDHNNTYKVIILNNKCNIPNEVLTTNGRIRVGVVAYLVENEQIIVRYNPSPVYFDSIIGSLKEADNTEPITPSEMEQFEQELNDGLLEVQNVDIDAEKVGTTTTITITNRNGEIKAVNVNDGQNGTNGTNGVGISSIEKTFFRKSLTESFALHIIISTSPPFISKPCALMNLTSSIP